MALTKPGKSLTLSNLANVLRGKFHAYYCLGSGGTPPTTQAGLEALYSDEDPFVPLGDLQKDPITWGWERESEELHAGTKRGLLKIKAEIKGVSLGPDQLAQMDLPEMRGKISVLLVPFKAPGTVSADTPLKAVILDGLQMTKSSEGNGNNKRSSVVFSLTAEPNTIGDVIKVLHIES